MDLEYIVYIIVWAFYAVIQFFESAFCIGILEKKSTQEKSLERNIRAQGQGSEIGIKISMELSKLAGVNIDIKSEPGHGTKVFLDFPRSTSPIQ